MGNNAKSDGVADAVQSLATSAAQTAVQTAKEKAAGLVEEKKASAADQVEDVARALGEVSQHVPLAGSYLREAASGIHQVSSTLRDRRIDQLIDDFGRFAARRPAALIGASVIGGFALARFLKSSADRRSYEHRYSPDAKARYSERSRRPDRPSGGSARPDSRDTEGTSEAALAGVRSPAAGMDPVSKLGQGSGSPRVGTSSAGGAADAPDQGTVR
jgi:hypothetical protein